jgi:hypothetical protein
MGRLLLLCLALAWPAPALAGDEGGAIAVLPLTSRDKRFEMYGVPVAKVLATELSSAGRPAQAVPNAAALPRRIAWVIDGRILERSGQRVVLEARLRDPGRGKAAGQVATRPGKLTEIDKLARELARELLPLLDRSTTALAATAPAAPPERSESQSGSRSESESESESESGSQSPSGSPSRSRFTSGQPPVLVIPRDREPIVTDAIRDLARRLGLRPVIGDLVGIASPQEVALELRRHGARLALLVEVQGVDYAWRGVLTARGRARVVLVSATGQPLWGDWLTTDTLVGSRGDRHAALLGFVARQVCDMVFAPLRNLLARR